MVLGTLSLRHDAGYTDETVTGVIRGIPIPSRFRGIRFYANFTAYALCSVVSSLFVAFVNVSIARHAVDTDVKALAYAAVVIGAVAGIGWLLQGASDLLYVRSLLRETRRD